MELKPLLFILQKVFNSELRQIIELTCLFLDVPKL